VLTAVFLGFPGTIAVLAINDFTFSGFFIVFIVTMHFFISSFILDLIATTQSCFFNK